MSEAETFSVVGSEIAFQGRIATVRVDTVVMPGGGTALREVVEHDRAVAVVAIDEAENVVLLEQYRHPLRRRLWELPAGLMDVQGESAQPAAARELGEEAGLAAGTWSLLVDIASSPGFTDEAVRIFLATDLVEIGRQGDVVDEEADLKVVRVPLSVAVQAALDGRIVNGSAVAGLLAASLVLGGPDRTRRPADEAWSSGPSTRHTGPGTPDAPVLVDGG